MKQLFRLTCVLLIFLLNGCQPAVQTAENQNALNMTQNQSKLRHVVLFRFKAEADPVAIARAEKAFMALPGKIPQILDFEWGLNNSPEGLNKGFTHCYVLTFGSEEDRDIYLPHPDHQAFGVLLDGILEDVTVVDYWTK